MLCVRSQSSTCAVIHDARLGMRVAHESLRVRVTKEDRLTLPAHVPLNLSKRYVLFQVAVYSFATHLD